MLGSFLNPLSKYQSLSQFCEALKTARPEISEMGEVYYVINKEKCYGWQLEHKCEGWNTEQECEQSKVKVLELVEKTKGTYEKGRKILAEHANLHIKRLQQVKENITKISGGNLSNEAVKKQIAIKDVIQFKLDKEIEKFKNSNDDFVRRLIVNVNKSIEEHGDKLVGVESIFKECILNADIQRLSLLENPIGYDDLPDYNFYKENPERKAIFLDNLIIKLTDINEQTQKQYPELFLKSLLPKSLRLQEFPKSIEIIQKHPVNRILLKIFAEAKEKDPNLCFLDLLTDYPHQIYYPIIKELIEKGHHLTKQAFLNSIRCSNYKNLDLLLSTQGVKKFINMHSESIIRDIIICNDLKAAEKFLAAGLDFSKVFDLIEEDLNNCENDLLEWLIQKGITSANQDLYNRLVEKALKTYNLKIIRLIATQIGDETVCRISYPGLIKIDQSNIRQMIKSFVVCSPYDEVCDFIKVKKVETDAAEFLEKAGLFVPFPKQQYRDAINNSFANIDDYINSTWKYAEENFKLIQKLKLNAKEMTWQEILEEVVEARYALMKIKNSQYKEMGGFFVASTPIRFNFFVNNHWGRYSPAFQYLMQLIDNKEIDIDLSKTHHIFRYGAENSDTLVDMTTVVFDGTLQNAWIQFVTGTVARWDHTPFRSFPIVAVSTEKLHKEIMNYDLSQGSIDELTNKIAHCYWLIATMCQMHRGTPHNAMMWLALACAVHGLPFFVPHMKSYFVDNFALVLSKDEFIKRFKTFFCKAINESLL